MPLDHLDYTNIHEVYEDEVRHMQKQSVEIISITKSAETARYGAMQDHIQSMLIHSLPTQTGTPAAPTDIKRLVNPSFVIRPPTVLRTPAQTATQSN